jgi:hypothetical protein
MTLDRTDRPVTVTSDGSEPAESRPPRSRPSRSRGRIVLVAVLLAVSAAGLWAYRANVQSARPRMDTSMRITGGATPFPVALATVERRPIAGR